MTDKEFGGAKPKTITQNYPRTRAAASNNNRAERCPGLAERCPGSDQHSGTNGSSVTDKHSSARQTSSRRCHRDTQETVATQVSQGLVTRNTQPRICQRDTQEPVTTQMSQGCKKTRSGCNDNGAIPNHHYNDPLRSIGNSSPEFQENYPDEVDFNRSRHCLRLRLSDKGRERSKKLIENMQLSNSGMAEHREADVDWSRVSAATNQNAASCKCNADWTTSMPAMSKCNGTCDWSVMSSYPNNHISLNNSCKNRNDTSYKRLIRFEPSSQKIRKPSKIKTKPQELSGMEKWKRSGLALRRYIADKLGFKQTEESENLQDCDNRAMHENHVKCVTQNKAQASVNGPTGSNNSLEPTFLNCVKVSPNTANIIQSNQNCGNCNKDDSRMENGTNLNLELNSPIGQTDNKHSIPKSRSFLKSLLLKKDKKKEKSKHSKKLKTSGSFEISSPGSSLVESSVTDSSPVSDWSRVASSTNQDTVNCSCTSDWSTPKTNKNNCSNERSSKIENRNSEFSLDKPCCRKSKLSKCKEDTNSKLVDRKKSGKFWKKKKLVGMLDREIETSSDEDSGHDDVSYGEVVRRRRAKSGSRDINTQDTSVSDTQISGATSEALSGLRYALPYLPERFQRNAVSYINNTQTQPTARATTSRDNTTATSIPMGQSAITPNGSVSSDIHPRSPKSTVPTSKHNNKPANDEPSSRAVPGCSRYKKKKDKGSTSSKTRQRKLESIDNDQLFQIRHFQTNSAPDLKNSKCMTRTHNGDNSPDSGSVGMTRTHNGDNSPDSRSVGKTDVADQLETFDDSLEDPFHLRSPASEDRTLNLWCPGLLNLMDEIDIPFMDEPENFTSCFTPLRYSNTNIQNESDEDFLDEEVLEFPDTMQSLSKKQNRTNLNRKKCLGRNSLDTCQSSVQNFDKYDERTSGSERNRRDLDFSTKGDNFECESKGNNSDKTSMVNAIMCSVNGLTCEGEEPEDEGEELWENDLNWITPEDKDITPDTEGSHSPIDLLQYGRSRSSSLSETSVEADDEFECDCEHCQLLRNHSDTHGVTGHDLDDEPSYDLGGDNEVARQQREDEMRYGAESESEFLHPFLFLSLPQSIPEEEEEERDFGLNISELTDLDFMLMAESSLRLDIMLENVIQQMLAVQPELLNEQAAPPAPSVVIDNLPTVIMTTLLLDKHPSCPICLCPCDLQEVMSQLPCQHIFHPICVEAWLIKSGTCPVCRGKV